MLKFTFKSFLRFLNTILAVSIFSVITHAQLPLAGIVYTKESNSNNILNYDPALPMSATNPAINTIQCPPNSHGIAISEVLGSSNATLTFYTVVQGIYLYYDPVTNIWINTGHSNSPATIGANIGGGGAFMFHLCWGNPPGFNISGDVYKYDGAGNSTYLMTLPNFSAFTTMADLAVDCAGNFYAFSLTEEFLRKYSPNGVLIQEWTVNNPNNYDTDGSLPGFVIIGDKLYIQLRTPGPIYNMVSGNITATSVDFVNPLLPIFNNLNGEDLASTASIADPKIEISASDTIICPGAIVTFTAMLSGGQNPIYQWFVNGAVVPGQTNATFSYNPNDGDMVRCQTIVTPGECFLGGTIVSNIITIHVKEPPLPVLEYNPSVFCIGQQESVTPLFSPSGGTFNATPIGLNIDIATGTIDINASTPGNYTITYKTGFIEGCEQHSITDIVTISALPLADISYANNPENICLGDAFNLQTPFQTSNRYEWLPQSYFPGGNREAAVTATVRENGVIYLTVVNEAGCINTDTVLLKGKPCCNIFVPNAFSPNGDNKNDFFLPYSTNPQKINQLSIYNRWGERVFVSSAQKDGWNGYHKDKPADGGTYFYYLSYECADGTIYIKKGDLTLLR